MFNKILIANRGEIACRIASTAKRLGVKTVAVFSEADRYAMHVKACDEAFCIGPAPVSESYLDSAKILQIALQHGVQAIHPGYGFLSENANFSRACETAGIVFIGPPASAIDAMGSKSESKRLMQLASVPLVPGYHGDDQSDSVLQNESNAIGFPQLIKASAGGGGKGMRIVNGPEEFIEALTSTRREAMASFGDDKMLIERYLTQPRHVELQIFADTQGSAVHLYERDCSIQRRYQKVLEEAPAPGMTEELRAQMGKAAIDAAKAINYVGAGTVEFLLDKDGSFYFMEMNTRLQVEHPVTEMITGQDLVHWQLMVASGLPLPLQQSEIQSNGHAFEARVYAEAPDNDFLPSTGLLHHLVTPKASDQVRIDTGVQQGDEISVFYDPMIAKLIVHAEDRKSALAKMRMALADYQVIGVQTNIGFLQHLLSFEEFENEDFDTSFIEKHHDQLFVDTSNIPLQVIVLNALYLLLKLQLSSDENARASADQFSPWNMTNGWRLNQPEKFQIHFSDEHQEYHVEVCKQGDNWSFKYQDVLYQVSGDLIDDRRLVAEIDHQRFDIPLVDLKHQITLWYQSRPWSFKRIDNIAAFSSSDAAIDELVSPMPGNVIELKVAVGDVVKTGDTLIVVEAMKMEHSILAPIDATVKEIFFQQGDQVEDGDRLISLD